MKKITTLLAILALCLASCERPQSETTYTLKNKLTDNYEITATVFEYDLDDNRVDSNSVVNPAVNQPYTFVANPLAHHLKVRLTSAENTVRWGKNIFYLVEGEDTPLTVGLSMMANYSLTEPTL